MQDLLPSQKSNSLYSGAGSAVYGGSVSGAAGAGGGNASSSNYSTTLTCNRNTLNNMFHTQIPPPPPAPTSMPPRYTASLQNQQQRHNQQQQPQTSHHVPPSSVSFPASSEKYYAATAICKANMSSTPMASNNYSAATTLAKTASNTETLPNGKIIVGLAGNLQNTQTLPSNLSSLEVFPKAGIVGVIAAKDAGAANAKDNIALTKPHHFNLAELSDITNIADQEELANCQIQEFPRHSLVIVEKLGCGVFGEYHLCETRDLR